ncbi:MAG: hypothetical protein PVJ34_07220 [Anaerolineae bacterium]|jgi:hypothetical protein
MKVAIRRISLGSLGRMGCLLGIVAAFLPSLLCGLLGMGLTGLIYRWLTSWQEVPLSVLGREITTFDFVQLMGLEKAVDVLQVLTSASGAVLALVVLALALLSGLLLALIIMVVGLGYNLLASATGGVVVEMQVPAKKEPAAEEPAERPSSPKG